MQKPYELYFHLNMAHDTSPLHQSIWVMVANHDFNERAVTHIPVHIDGQFKFENLNFADTLNHVSNNSWFSTNEYFDTMHECVQFLEALKAFVFIVEQDKSSKWWDAGVYDDELVQLLNEMKKLNA